AEAEETARHANPLFAAYRVPKARGIVPTGRGQEVTHGTKLHVEDGRLVSFQDRLQALLVYVVDVDEAVSAPGCQRPAVAAPSRPVERGGMRESCPFLTRVDIEDLQHVIARVAAGEQTTARIKTDAVGKQVLAETPDLLAVRKLVEA